MQLRAILFATFGSVLSTGQTINQGSVTVEENGGFQHPTEVNANGESGDVPYSPFGIRNTPKQNGRDCVHTPMMPKTFFMKRKFNTLLNTIILTDRYGYEFGYVRSWLLDWKNPFGYPGASFYIKGKPAEAREGVYRIDPKQGPYGWAAPNRETLNHHGVDKSEVWKAEQQHERMHGSGSYDVENLRNGRLAFGNNQNRLSAYMTGEVGNFLEGAVSPKMIIKDCNRKEKFHATGDRIKVHHAGQDAQFYTKLGETENDLVISDFSTPTQEMVRVSMKEPCAPFPPFCQQMGSWNWVWHGNEWEGQIVQPGYNETIASGPVGVVLDDGAATDMRFLALYTAYQFSNTRWSPLSWWFALVFLIILAVGGFRLCYVGGATACYNAVWCRPTKCCGINNCGGCCSEPERVLKDVEETEKLMNTMEKEATGARDKPNNPFNCCSRKR